jgi:hypothetical protein
MRGVADDHAIAPPHRLILLRVALHLNGKNGRLDPPYDMIASEVGVDRRTVLRAISSGTRRGWLTATRRGPMSNAFALTIRVNSAPEDVTAVSHQEPVSDANDVTLVTGRCDTAVASPHTPYKIQQAKNGQTDTRPSGLVSESVNPDFFGKPKTDAAEDQQKIKRDRRTAQPEGDGGRYVPSEAEVLKVLRSFAHSYRVCLANGWPTGDDAKIDSGDDVEPDMRDDLKAVYRRAWLKLSAEDQQLLARWWAKNIGPEPSNNSDAFARFWSVYPKRVAKLAAEKAFAKAIKTIDAETIIEAAKHYAVERASEPPRYTTHPAKWLNDGRWADEVKANGQPILDQHGNVVGHAKPPPRGSAQELVQRRAAERANGGDYVH